MQEKHSLYIETQSTKSRVSKEKFDTKFQKDKFINNIYIIDLTLESSAIQIRFFCLFTHMYL